VLLYLITLVFVGLIVGGLGRLSLPGPDPLTIGQTILVGIAGSLIAGLIVWAIYGRGGAGILLSVFCSAGIVYVIRRRRGGSLTDPGRPPLRRR
jgi:uncharacterized membrane protein YeaQ/YmgE (transglycosylase-associated protein family)